MSYLDDNIPKIEIEERNADFPVYMDDEGVLKDIGVHPGDILFIKKTKKISDGDIIALRVADGLVIYKYIVRDNDILLSPENKDIPSIPCTYEQFSQMVVIGKATALLRGM